MAEKIVYLVTSGDFADFRPEAVMSTPELAYILKTKVDEGQIWPMPVLDYVPEKVTEHHYRIDRSSHGWRDGLSGPFSEEVWDFQAAKLAPRVQFGTAVILVFHREAEVARDHAEHILSELTGDGSR